MLIVRKKVKTNSSKKFCIVWCHSISRRHLYLVYKREGMREKKTKKKREGKKGVNHNTTMKKKKHNKHKLGFCCFCVMR